MCVLSSCPSWRNKAGDVIAAKSICQDDGSWSEPRAFPPGELQMPTSLNKPDEEMMGCGCHALNLTYDPNTYGAVLCSWGILTCLP